MLRETRWLAGALAAAMWIAPAAAQSGSTGTSEQPSGTSEQPSGSGAEKSTTDRMKDSARDTSTAAGNAASETGTTAKAMGQQRRIFIFWRHHAAQPLEVLKIFRHGQ